MRPTLPPTAPGASEAAGGGKPGPTSPPPAGATTPPAAAPSATRAAGVTDAAVASGRHAPAATVTLTVLLLTKYGTCLLHVDLPSSIPCPASAATLPPLRLPQLCQLLACVDQFSTASSTEHLAVRGWGVTLLAAGPCIAAVVVPSCADFPPARHMVRLALHHVTTHHSDALGACVATDAAAHEALMHNFTYDDVAVESRLEGDGTMPPLLPAVTGIRVAWQQLLALVWPSASAGVGGAALGGSGVRATGGNSSRGHGGGSGAGAGTGSAASPPPCDDAAVSAADRLPCAVFLVDAGASVAPLRADGHTRAWTSAARACSPTACLTASEWQAVLAAVRAGSPSTLFVQRKASPTAGGHAVALHTALDGCVCVVGVAPVGSGAPAAVATATRRVAACVQAVVSVPAAPIALPPLRPKAPTVARPQGAPHRPVRHKVRTAEPPA